MPAGDEAGVDAAGVRVNRDRHVVQLNDVVTGEELRRFVGEEECSSGNIAAFAPDSKTLAIYSGTATVTLWDPATGEVRRRFQARAGMDSLLVFSPELRRHATYWVLSPPVGRVRR